MAEHALGTLSQMRPHSSASAPITSTKPVRSLISIRTWRETQRPTGFWNVETTAIVPIVQYTFLVFDFFRIPCASFSSLSTFIHVFIYSLLTTPNTVLVPHGDTEVNDHSGDLGDEWHVFSISKIYITCKIAKHGDRGKV